MSNELYERMAANPWLIPFRFWVTGAFITVCVMACADLGFYNEGWCFLLAALMFYLYGVSAAYVGRHRGRMKAMRRLQQI